MTQMPSAPKKCWQQLFPEIHRFPDSCNVYAIEGPRGTVFVNAGSGDWLEGIDAQFKPPYFLLLTHFFRDHSAGASKASRLGIEVFAPWGECQILNDPIEHFRSLENYVAYENLWESFAPITPTIANPIRDYEDLRLAGLTFTSIPLPGVTPHHTGFQITTPQSGRQVVFCGEAVHSHGRMARIAPLQHDYADLSGAVNAASSAACLQSISPDVLLPSLGAPLQENIADALEALQSSLGALCSTRIEEATHIGNIGRHDLERVSDHVWMSTESVAISWFIVSESNKVLAIDYGYSGGCDDPRPAVGPWKWPTRNKVLCRRALLHSIQALEKTFGIDTVDVVLLSHFHDDHVAGVPVLQRLHDTRCWTLDHIAPLVEYPEAHRFPCNWPERTRVDRVIAADEVVEWEGIRFHFEPMSGHTRFSALIGFEVDGLRFAHTGDQLLPSDHDPEDGEWKLSQFVHTEVYRNGADLTSFRKSADWLCKWRPDFVLSGHQRAIRTTPRFFDAVQEVADTFERDHLNAMVLGPDEVHFGLDSMAGWIWPYRVSALVNRTTKVSVVVRNPRPEPTSLHLRLVVPDGWMTEPKTVAAEPRQEVLCDLEFTPMGVSDRIPIALELRTDKHNFGQIAEALVTCTKQ